MENLLQKIIEKAKYFDRKSVNFKATEKGRLDFVKRFPLNKLKEMTLEEYSSGTTNDSFCYWLEFKKITFGIGGGNANKFGIYRGHDGNTYNKVGHNKHPLSTIEANEAFNKIKRKIIEGLEIVKNDNFEKLVNFDIPMWPMVFTKILQVYFPEKFVSIGKNDTIIKCSEELGIDFANKQNNTVYLNHLIKKKLSESELFSDWNYEELGVFLWKYYTNIEQPKYFKIAPGEVGAYWEACKNAGEIRVNYQEIEDLDSISSEEELKKEFSKTLINPPLNQFTLELWQFKNLKVGDIILANRGISGVLGLGRVTKGYYWNNEYNEYKHCVGVDWYDTNYQPKALPKDWPFHTLVELSESKFNEIINEVNYWIFQANPDIFDVVSALKEEKIESWLVNQNKNSMKIGDKIILWVTGVQSGCYALGEIMGEPQEIELEPDDHFWKEAKPRGLRVKINITHNFVENPILKKDLVDISEFKNLRAGNQGTNLKATKEEYEKMIELSNKDAKGNNLAFSHPRNIILYGPPGTGKTYSTKRKAVEVILNRKIEKDENIDFDAEFKKFKADGRIEFVTFHQSYSYEQFVEGISVLTSIDEKKDVIYKVKSGVLKELSERIKNYEKLVEKESLVIGKTFDYNRLFSAFVEKLNLILVNLEDGEKHFFESRRKKVFLLGINGESIDTQGENANKNEVITKEQLKRIYDKFATPEDIKNIVADIRSVGTDLGWTTNYYAVFKAFKDFETSLNTSNTSNNVEIKRNSVLIIDEINRGNISKIFGELITLIEDDKRLGEENEIIVTLPYSGEQFGVPPNLYIIGTMNTADRSLVQLDTALRRRFDFEEMMPKYDFWSTKVGDFDLILFLQNLNNKISEQYDREHQIGHSYLMKVKDIDELQRAWENRIMPLLQEYFYADYEQLSKVIGKDSEYLKQYDKEKESGKWKLSMKAGEDKADGQSNFAVQFNKVYEFVTKEVTG